MKKRSFHNVAINRLVRLIFTKNFWLQHNTNFRSVNSLSSLGLTVHVLIVGSLYLCVLFLLSTESRIN